MHVIVMSLRARIAWTVIAIGIAACLASACNVLDGDERHSCEPACKKGGALHLPIEIIGSNPVTEIAVGDKVVQAIVDTGGGAIALSEDVIRNAGGVRLKKDREWSDALGQKYRVPQFKVPRMGIGGRTFRDVVVIQAAVRDGPAVANSIGGQFLGDYISVIDYPGLSITLWPISEKERTDAVCGKDVIRLEKTGQADLAVSVFNGPFGHLELLWDTGASYSMLPGTLVASRGLATTRKGETTFYGPVELSAAGRTFGPLEFVVLPLQLPGDFDGMLGANFFMEHVVCLDFQRREVRVR